MKKRPRVFKKHLEGRVLSGTCGPSRLEAGVKARKAKVNPERLAKAAERKHRRHRHIRLRRGIEPAS